MKLGLTVPINSVEDEIRLTTEEVRQSFDGDMTDEQVETIKDFLSLAAVIAYEGIERKSPRHFCRGL